MSVLHFAEIDDAGVILRVVAVSSDDAPDEATGEAFLQRLTGGGKWVLEKPERKNPAAIGYTYDKDLDAIITKAPGASWALDEVTCEWVPPVEKPEGVAMWDEKARSWAVSEEITAACAVEVNLGVKDGLEKNPG